MSLRVRVIPLTVVVASLFLMIKMVDLIQGGQKLSESLLVGRVEAEDKPAEKPKEPEKPSAEAKAEEKKPDTAKPEEKKAEGDKPADKKEGDKKPEEKKEGEKKDAEKKPEKGSNPNVTATPGDIADRRFTTVEVELLQKLAKRREELDVWESNLQIKETALDATEKRIDDKIAQVEAMKKAVAQALAEYNKIEDTEIASLVKIYENMKPVDAARIFDELDRPILLLIVDRMAEKKASPILAAMDSKRAKQLTVDLAEQRRIKSNNMSAAGGMTNTANGATASAPTPATPASPAEPAKK